jgi:hypothetical protein
VYSRQAPKKNNTQMAIWMGNMTINQYKWFWGIRFSDGNFGVYRYTPCLDTPMGGMKYGMDIKFR